MLGLLPGHTDATVPRVQGLGLQFTATVAGVQFTITGLACFSCMISLQGYYRAIGYRASPAFPLQGPSTPHCRH
jgi:hypothetical protein